MNFALQPRHLRNLKETLLVITVLYFYGLAFALYFRRPTFDLDRPVFFLSMSALFLCAMILEAVLAWWNKRARLWWTAFVVATYGLVGLVVAPSLLGQRILIYVLFVPLALTVYGGIVFLIGRLIIKLVWHEPLLTRRSLKRELSKLPGWNIAGGKLHKTFEFEDFFKTLNFVNQIGALSLKQNQFPLLHIAKTRVRVTLMPRNVILAVDDLRLAHQIDAL